MPSLPFEPLLRPIPFVRDFGVARASEIRHSPVRCFAHSIRVLRHISHTPFTHYPAGAESLRPHFAPFTSGRTSRHLCLVLPRGSILLQCLGGSLAYHFGAHREGYIELPSAQPSPSLSTPLIPPKRILQTLSFVHRDSRSSDCYHHPSCAPLTSSFPAPSIRAYSHSPHASDCPIIASKLRATLDKTFVPSQLRAPSSRFSSVTPASPYPP